MSKERYRGEVIVNKMKCAEDQMVVIREGGQKGRVDYRFVLLQTPGVTMVWPNLIAAD